MRYSICILLAGLMLAGPALGQTNAPANKPAAGNQKAGEASQSGTPAASSPQAAAKPATPPAKDETMGNFDITGSSANDAMGSAPP